MYISISIYLCILGNMFDVTRWAFVGRSYCLVRISVLLAKRSAALFFGNELSEP